MEASLRSEAPKAQCLATSGGQPIIPTWRGRAPSGGRLRPMWESATITERVVLAVAHLGSLCEHVTAPWQAQMHIQLDDMGWAALFGYFG